jgi:hypothetical protein
VYSLAVNTLGALTTNQIPPLAEVLNLEKLSGKQERYSYGRSYEYILSNESNSFVFGVFGQKYMTAFQYFLTHVSVLSVVTVFLMYRILFLKSKTNEN